MTAPPGPCSSLALYEPRAEAFEIERPELLDDLLSEV